MDNKDFLSAEKSLKLLASKIIATTDNLLSQGKIFALEEPFFKFSHDDFRYDRNGPEYSHSSGIQFINKSWNIASNRIYQEICQTAEYQNAFDELNKISPQFMAPRAMQSFIEKFALYYLEEHKQVSETLENFISIIMKEVKNEAVKYWAIIELEGVILMPDKIEFQIGNMNYLLRQTTAKDGEALQPLIDIRVIREEKIPSAILNIEFPETSSLAVPKYVNLAMAILRLFKVGSIKYSSYTIHSEAFSAFTGKIPGENPSMPFFSYRIEKDEINNFKEFWNSMNSSMYDLFFNRDKSAKKYLRIAFDRYCDAITKNGMIERIIANAVMGLEALFLDENYELQFRLKQRLAKLFGLLHYDPYIVQEIISKSYEIRSQFVHGGEMDQTKINKIIKKYGGLKDFLYPLIDYLRVSIIIFSMIQIGKKEIIGLLDNSTFDRKKEENLLDLLKRIKITSFTNQKK